MDIARTQSRSLAGEQQRKACSSTGARSLFRTTRRSIPRTRALPALLAAAIPVCAGISLEYYFSFVDNEGYGCGTKLPHNITGLVGVMNGHASDLRTGLPWQMVEIHEPVRNLFNIETTPERLMSVINANPTLREFVENRWIRLSTLDPTTGVIHVYRDGIFEVSAPWTPKLPEARSSADWYRGKREHLPVAKITGSASWTVIHRIKKEDHAHS